MTGLKKSKKLEKKILSRLEASLIILLSSFLLTFFVTLIKIGESTIYHAGSFGEIYVDLLFITTLPLMISFLPFSLLPFAAVVLFYKSNMRRLWEWIGFGGLITYLFSVIVISIATPSSVTLDSILRSTIPICLFVTAIFVFSTTITKLVSGRSYAYLLPLILIFLNLLMGLIFAI